MDRVTYVPEAVREVGSRTCSLSVQMQALFDELMTKAKSICGESWQGEAARCFQDAHQKWDLAAQEFTDAENRCGIATQNGVVRAVEADAKGAAGFLA